MAKKSKGCPLCNPDYKPPKSMRERMDSGSIFAYACDVTGEVGYLFNKDMYTDAEALAEINYAFERAGESYTDPIIPKKEYLN